VLVVMPDGGEQVAKMVVVQGVVDVAAVTPCLDEPQRSQQPQMVRRRADAQGGGGRELLDRARPGQEVGEQAKAARRGERLQRLGELVGLVRVERPVRSVMFGGMRHGC
jgi:hypothetical protein